MKLWPDTAPGEVSGEIGNEDYRKPKQGQKMFCELPMYRYQQLLAMKQIPQNQMEL